MTHIGNEERRRRIGVRHRLAPGSRASSLREAAASMVVLHATDPAGLFLDVPVIHAAATRAVGAVERRRTIGMLADAGTGPEAAARLLGELEPSVPGARW